MAHKGISAHVTGETSPSKKCNKIRKVAKRSTRILNCRKRVNKVLKVTKKVKKIFLKVDPINC